MVGGSLGTVLVKALQSLGNFDFVLKATYVVMLLGVGSFMFVESINSLRKKDLKDSGTQNKSKAVDLMNKLPMKMKFEVSGIDCSVICFLAWLIDWNTCCSHGRWRWIHHAACYDLPFRNADN